VKAFIDTNVLIYALSADDALKQAQAQALLDLPQAARYTISTQVLVETWHVLTRRKGWPAAEALAAVKLFAALDVVAPRPDAALRALALAGEHRLSAWDALIVQAALDAGCDTLFSEDLQSGRRFGGTLELVNPFAPRLQEPAPGTAARRRGRRA
jgi:predicted nucleic acid-binding protein